MNDKNYKKKNMKRLLAGLAAVLLTAGVPAEQMQCKAAVAETGTEQPRCAAPAEQIPQQMPECGRLGFVTEQVECVIPGGSSMALRSTTPSLQQYEWDCYSTDYYFSKLEAKEQLLYERLDAACGELLSSADKNADYHQVTQKDGTKVKRRGTEMVSTLGLTLEQVKKVQTLFVYANPQYYFLNVTLLATDKACALGIYDAFAEGTARAEATRAVFDRMKQLQSQIADSGIVYDTARQIHDVLCDNLYYKSGYDVLSDSTDPYYTQSIYGALTEGDTVCAGYTKLYTMLCNYYGIDCISVTSNDHAWNQVRYGDHWYVVDVTWDDEGSAHGDRFFHITDQQMSAMDQDSAHVPHSFYQGILPPADTTFSAELMTMQGMEQPRAEVTDTAGGAMITLSAQTGEVYYTLDGTRPEAGDIYTQPIELTSGGTYVVTAVAEGEGMIPSAYEIFSVRIAGGSVSISSAANVKGKKIKVKYKSSKSYTGYEVGYASKRDFSNQKCAKVSSKSVTIRGLKKGKTYYIRVRGYKKDAYGNDYYTPYSKTKKVKIKK